MSSIKGVTQGTVRAYENDLTLFFRFLKIEYGLTDTEDFQEIKINDIDKNFLNNIELGDIYSFLSYLENERGNSNATRARKIACLKSFFGYSCKKAKIIDHNIADELETPRIKKKVPVYLNENESRKLIKSISGRHAERDRCMVVLFLNTGLRLSELCSINISSIKGDTLVVKGKGDKERKVYLNDSCLKAIKEYLPVRDKMMLKVGEKDADALFISQRWNRISKRAVEDVVKSCVEGAGLSSKYSTHKLRHTAATLMYRAGADIRSIQEILGHESISTTQIYTHVADEQLRNAVKINPLNDTRSA